MHVVGCPRCGEPVAVHEGRPHVTASGVQLWHGACWEQRDAPSAGPIETPSEPPPRTKRRRWLAALLAPASVLAIGVARPRAATIDAPAVTNADDFDEPELAEPRFAIAARDDAPPPVTAPHDDGDPEAIADGSAADGSAASIDEQYPTLTEWVHPVLATTERYPAQQSRHFGAKRAGVMRAECGAGHCGVDLDGPRGRPIVAVAAGTVVRVERHELGLDGRSGRYVRIQHEDGTLTSYMHLDRVADALHVGDRVLAGQMIGTLGATACFSAPAHLHFSLEVPARPDLHGDITETRYVDPAPYLERATVLDEPHGEPARAPISS